MDLEKPSLELLKTKKKHLNDRINGVAFKWMTWLGCLVTGAIFFIIISYFWVRSTVNYDVYKLVLFLIVIGLTGACFGGVVYWGLITSKRSNLEWSLRKVESDLALLGFEELKETIQENFFTKLVQINFKYLDQYYFQTQEQANKSFRLSLFASISGLLIVLFGIGMMFSGGVSPAYVTTATGLLSEFIAAVFFYLYNKTILKMSQYHQKLVLTQNISLALKITDDMPTDQKMKCLELLIDRLTLDINKYLIIDIYEEPQPKNKKRG